MLPQCWETRERTNLILSLPSGSSKGVVSSKTLISDKVIVDHNLPFLVASERVKVVDYIDPHSFVINSMVEDVTRCA